MSADDIARRPDDFAAQRVIAGALGLPPMDDRALRSGLRAVRHLLRAGLVIVPAADLSRVCAPYPRESAELERARERLYAAADCRCPTVHGHCYAVNCLCPLHADEVGAL